VPATAELAILAKERSPMKVSPAHQAREKERVMGKSKRENQLMPTEEMLPEKALILIHQIMYIKRMQLQKWHPKK
jgi:hypothetical protein